MDPVAVHLRHLDDAWAHKWESLTGVLDGPATPIFWNIDKSE